MSDYLEVERRRGEAIARKHPVKAATKILPRKILEAEVAEAQGDATRKGRAEAHAEGIAAGLGQGARCGRCGRLLTNPRSVHLAIGPDCLREFGGTQAWRGYTTRLVAAHRNALERRMQAVQERQEPA